MRSDNQLGDKSAEEIARALSYNRTLKHLDLSGNTISAAGMAFMSKFFASRSVVAPVEELNLSSNQIDVSSFDEFVKKSLKINPFLKTVDLSGSPACSTVLFKPFLCVPQEISVRFLSNYYEP
jgi:Ran GTPase-activating protein (RanGAP) involved in mRNA processing and transport